MAKIRKQHFIFDNPAIDFELINGGILEPYEERTITISGVRNFAGQKIKFPADNEQDFVWFCC
jgi:hypothetical protein